MNREDNLSKIGARLSTGAKMLLISLYRKDDKCLDQSFRAELRHEGLLTPEAGLWGDLTPDGEEVADILLIIGDDPFARKSDPFKEYIRDVLSSWRRAYLHPSYAKLPEKDRQTLAAAVEVLAEVSK